MPSVLNNNLQLAQFLPPFSLCSLYLHSFVLFLVFKSAVTFFLCWFLPTKCPTDPLSKLTDCQYSSFRCLTETKKGMTNQTRQESRSRALPDHLQQLLLSPDQVSPGGSPHTCWLGSKAPTFKLRNYQIPQVKLKLSCLGHGPPVPQETLQWHWDVNNNNKNNKLSLYSLSLIKCTRNELTLTVKQLNNRTQTSTTAAGVFH